MLSVTTHRRRPQTKSPSLAEEYSTSQFSNNLADLLWFLAQTQDDTLVQLPPLFQCGRAARSVAALALRNATDVLPRLQVGGRPTDACCPECPQSLLLQIFLASSSTQKGEAMSCARTILLPNGRHHGFSPCGYVIYIGTNMPLPSPAALEAKDGTGLSIRKNAMFLWKPP